MNRGVDRLIQPVVLAVLEHHDERVADGPFGVHGGRWATVFGVTLGDANETVSGKNWSGGQGAWRVPRGDHPVTVGLDLWLVVRSPSFTGALEGFSDGGPFLQREELQPTEIAAFIEAYVASVGVVTWDELVPALKRVLVVEDA